ncbi:VOC family protein [Pseudonocardia endophytica]|uniref:VOC family protein n=1 Tax=Pseudonocardia endophytica TaxID=401976 RepID=UPI001FB1BB02|nr:VOC family protein [Pseudonocardia endophytica]
MEQVAARLGVHEVDLTDWRWLLGALHAHFDTRSFRDGATFVDVVAEAAGADDDHLHVDLRAGHVRIALRTADVGGVTQQDVLLAERISLLARDRDLTSRPQRVQVMELALDTPVSDSVRPFWAAVLAGHDEGRDVVDPAQGLPSMWFQATDSTAPDRQRFHLDVTVPPEVAGERIAAAVAAGGSVVDDGRSPAFVVLADPDGNTVCICTELGRE